MIFKKLRKDFPILDTQRNGHKLIYFDNAATTQKPKEVVEAISNFYLYNYGPIKRGIYYLSEHATELYENARQTIANFINAKNNEIIFTSGTTDGINFLAYSWANNNINKDDIIILTELEHHSNLVPWIRLAESKGAIIKYIPIDQDGNLNYSKFLELLNKKVKLVVCSTVSNVLGNYIDVEFIIKNSHNVGAKVLLDAAQSIAHSKIDIKKLDTDFLVFSGHKILGPTGIGVLYIKETLHDYIEPYKVGGGMVFNVQKENVTWLEAPYKYEAGTPPFVQAIGLAKAIDYLNKNIDFKELKNYEASLCSYLIDSLDNIDGIKILGSKEDLKKSGHLVAFSYSYAHAHDIAAYFDLYNICVRAGHHCAQPLHEKLCITGSTRVSFYFYNTKEEIDKFINIFKEFTKVF